MTNVPVITIDGPSGSGKGTISQMLARELGWHILDSGALYRTLAYYLDANSIFEKDFIENLEKIKLDFNVSFVSDSLNEPVKVILNQEDITSRIRTEEVARRTSLIATYQAIRDFIKPCQRSFLSFPGLIADGRDMGTVIFPEAFLKVYLTASHEERTRRRYSQLKTKGTKVNMRTLSDELKRRDGKDSTRKNSPLSIAKDAITIDTTNIKPDSVLERIKEMIK